MTKIAMWTLTSVLISVVVYFAIAAFFIISDRQKRSRPQVKIVWPSESSAYPLQGVAAIESLCWQETAGNWHTGSIRLGQTGWSSCCMVRDGIASISSPWPSSSVLQVWPRCILPTCGDMDMHLRDGAISTTLTSWKTICQISLPWSEG